MYALSTLVMAHREYVLSFYPTKTPAMVTERELDYTRSFPATATREEIGRQMVEDLGLEGRHSVSAKLPAVLSIVKDFGEPRYPSFMGIRKASRAVIPVWSLADLGLGNLQANVTWPEIMNPPQRQVTTEMITGGSPQEIGETLADKILAEKIL